MEQLASLERRLEGEGWQPGGDAGPWYEREFRRA
jgi:hypothetical protein